MKKRKIFLALILTITALFLLSPLLLKQKQIKDSANRYLSTYLGVKNHTGDIHWNWFPFPAIEVEDVSMQSEDFSLQIKKLLLYPNINSLVRKQVSLGRIKLIHPTLLLKDTPGFFDLSKISNIPQLNISISGGNIEFPANYFKNSSFASQKMFFNNIESKLSTDQGILQLKFKSDSNFAQEIRTKGQIDLSTLSYAFDFEGQDFNLKNIINLSEEIAWKPTESNVIIKGSIEGMGLNQGNLVFKDPLSSFAIGFKESTLKINSLNALKISWRDKEIYAEVDNLNIYDPSLTLDAKISKYINSNNQEPLWNLNLHADNIDLSQLRKHLSASFDKDSFVQEVCSIVLGGKAKNIIYSFSGTETDLKDLKKLKLSGEAVDVPVYITDLDLMIDKTNGSFEIIDGLFQSDNFTANLDKSHGNNGHIKISLPRDEHTFKLDINLNVDLNNLHDALGKIFTTPDFTKELQNFSNISGRTHGQLVIGDSFNKLLTSVNIEDIKGKGLYKRIPWPFELYKGSIQVDHDGFSGKGIEIKLADQHISRIDGELDWQDKVSFVISELDAVLNLETFFKEGYLETNSYRLSVNDSFSHILKNISGSAHISKTSVKGLIKEPDNWEFNTFINTSNVSADLLSLSENIKSKVVQAKLSTDMASFTGIFNFLNQDLYVSGNYKHRNLKKFRGKTELNGMISEEVGQWLKKQEWFDLNFFPRLPFRIEKFKIITSEPSLKYFIASGNIIATKKNKSKAVLEIETNRQQDLEMTSLNFLDGNEQGKLTYNVWRNQSMKTMLNWQGVITSSTIDYFFDNNFLNSGRIQGVFSKLSSLSEPIETTYAGYIEAYDLSWSQPDDEMPVSIKTFKGNGDGNILKINYLELGLGDEQVSINGAKQINEQNYDLNLNINSDELTINRLQLAFNSFKSKYDRLVSEDGKDIDDDTKERLYPDNISGKINFNIGRFNYLSSSKKFSESTNENQIDNNASFKSEHKYTWSPLKGTLTTEEKNSLKLELTESRICDLPMNGLIYFGEKSDESFFEFTTNDNQADFEKTLPCLGVEQSLIDGPFTFEGRIQGMPDKWNSGNFTIKSKEGIIKKMKILSSIFSVVNFTDLFTFNDLPDLDKDGLIYNDLLLETSIKDNELKLNQARLTGKGVNLTGEGIINLESLTSDLTFFIAPFKLIDTVITSVPIVGTAIGGSKQSILTIPVSVTGPLDNPEVTALKAGDVGSAALDLLLDTLTLPVRLFIGNDRYRDLRNDNSKPTEQDVE